jgi:hypothetical protein
MLVLDIDGQTHQFNIEPETPMVWALRDEVGLTGTSSAAVRGAHDPYRRRREPRSGRERREDR